MLLLAIDTSTSAIAVALHDGERVLAERSTIDARHHTEHVAPSISAVRGRQRSARESRNHEVARRTRGPPNITNALSSGDPVSAYASVPRARLPTDPAPTFSDVVVNSTRNSAIPKSSR